MYSHEMRRRAVELYLELGKRPAAVVHILGYPSRRMLSRWYDEYLEELRTGILHDRYRKVPCYSQDKQQIAVNHYLEHGRNLARTIRALGYPNRGTLRMWCDAAHPVERRPKAHVIQFSPEQKKDAVVALCSRRCGASEVAEAHGVTRAALYKWKHELLGKEDVYAMPDKDSKDLPDDRDQLLAEVETLKRQIRRLKLEKDILEGTAALLKKDPGVDPARLTNREKATLVDALKTQHPLGDLLQSLSLWKSSYYYQHCAMSAPDKYEHLRARIVELFHATGNCYGYRRIRVLLIREGRRISERVVRTIMAAAGLIALVKRKRKYSSYQGEISPAPENLLQRDFTAEHPNLKWLTDISEFHIPAGKVFLSPILDCFDGILVSWTISTRPDSELVNCMLDRATARLKVDETPILHSDRGGHYRWPGWLERIENRGLIRSMSQKGCSPDNAACEGLFGRIKNEMFYNRSWQGVSLEEFMDRLDRYLHWYNDDRIKMSLGGLSPVEYRRTLGYEV